jgi:hypothetical protein
VPVTIRRNFGPLTDIVRQSITKADWEAAGRLARERIIRRTVMGIAPGGSAFAPYSPGYAKAKAEALGSASPVNLQVSGEMLRGITVQAFDNRVELSFVG